MSGGLEISDWWLYCDTNLFSCDCSALPCNISVARYRLGDAESPGGSSDSDSDAGETREKRSARDAPKPAPPKPAMKKGASNVSYGGGE